MSKSVEQASIAVATPGRRNQVHTGSPQPLKQHSAKDDLSLTHVGAAIGVFALMVGLFGYGFYIQQTRVSEKEAAQRITGVSSPSISEVPSTFSNGLAEAATGSHPLIAATVKEEPIASPIPAQIKSVHADIYFDFGKTRLRADAIATLQEQAEILKQDSHWAVLIQGYTDRHGSTDYNRALALRRGDSVKQFLAELGVPADSMKVVSLGQDAVLCDDHTPTCKRLNRRVHLELVKLETPIISLAPRALTPPIMAQPDMTTSPIDPVESGASADTPDADLHTVVSPAADTLDATIPSSESH
jgi:peptidoglycan-associated lipoprotein